MTYSEKLRDPRWQKKRLEILERDGFKCRDCKAKDKTLHVHHCRYEKGDPWEIEPAYLITLCCDCHKERGPIEEKLKRYLCDMFYIYNCESLRKIAERPQLSRRAK